MSIKDARVTSLGIPVFTKKVSYSDNADYWRKIEAAVNKLNGAKEMEGAQELRNTGLPSDAIANLIHAMEKVSPAFEQITKYMDRAIGPAIEVFPITRAPSFWAKNAKPDILAHDTELNLNLPEDEDPPATINDDQLKLALKAVFK